VVLLQKMLRMLSPFSPPMQPRRSPGQAYELTAVGQRNERTNGRIGERARRRIKNRIKQKINRERTRIDANIKGNSTADEPGLTRIVWTTVHRNFICVYLRSSVVGSLFYSR